MDKIKAEGLRVVNHLKTVQWKEVINEARGDVLGGLQHIRTAPQFGTKGAGAYVFNAFFLGLVFGAGWMLFLLSSFCDLGLFMVFWSFFHLGEFTLTAMYNFDTLSVDSFLLNHSRQFTIAIVASFVEYTLEALLLPSMKGTFIMYIGALIALAGQVIRLLALLTARHNFTHLVAEEKKDQHVLVTKGIYGFSRHPGYMGWFFWAVGTQIIMFNPICIAGYAWASWTFFHDRIQFEESHLLKFFADYSSYRQRVPVLIPGIL